MLPIIGKPRRLANAASSESKPKTIRDLIRPLVEAQQAQELNGVDANFLSILAKVREEDQVSRMMVEQRVGSRKRRG